MKKTILTLVLFAVVLASYCQEQTKWKLLSRGFAETDDITMEFNPLQNDRTIITIDLERKTITIVNANYRKEYIIMNLNKNEPVTDKVYLSFICVDDNDRRLQVDLEEIKYEDGSTSDIIYFNYKDKTYAYLCNFI